MSRFILTSLILSLAFMSCGKFDKDCDKDLSCSFCMDKDFPVKDNVADNSDFDKGQESDLKGKDFDNKEKGEHKGCDKDKKSVMEEIVVEPIYYDESCGCATSGLVKYVKDNKTIALVKYDDPECTGYGIKIQCYNGDCESSKAKCCKFEQDCSPKE
jgi:hypothetical protein